MHAAAAHYHLVHHISLDCCCITNSREKKREHMNECMEIRKRKFSRCKTKALFWVEVWAELSQMRRERSPQRWFPAWISLPHHHSERACLVLFSELCVRGAFIWEEISSFLVGFLVWGWETSIGKRASKNWYDFQMMIMTIIYSVRRGGLVGAS